jgi:arabinogalactan endo-1,4-beta-galactosidase
VKEEIEYAEIQNDPPKKQKPKEWGDIHKHHKRKDNTSTFHVDVE